MAFSNLHVAAGPVFTLFATRLLTANVRQAVRPESSDYS